MPALTLRQLQTAPAREASPLARRTYFCAGDGLRCAAKVARAGDVCYLHPPCSVCAYARQSAKMPMPHTLQGRPCPYAL